MFYFLQKLVLKDFTPGMALKDHHNPNDDFYKYPCPCHHQICWKTYVFTSAFPTDFMKTFPPLHRQRRIFFYFIVCSVSNTVPKYHSERQLWTMMVKDIPLGLRDAHTSGFIVWSIPQCTSHQWQLARGLSTHSRQDSCVKNPINSNQRKQQKSWSSLWDSYALCTHPYQNNLA